MRRRSTIRIISFVRTISNGISTVGKIKRDWLETRCAPDEDGPPFSFRLDESMQRWVEATAK